MSKTLDYIALIIVFIGALNWGLIGLFRLDLVRMLFGDMSWISRLVYVLVGICGIYLLTFFGRLSREDGPILRLTKRRTDVCRQTETKKRLRLRRGNLPQPQLFLLGCAHFFAGRETGLDISESAMQNKRRGTNGFLKIRPGGKVYGTDRAF